MNQIRIIQFERNILIQIYWMKAKKSIVFLYIAGLRLGHDLPDDMKTARNNFALLILTVCGPDVIIIITES